MFLIQIKPEPNSLVNTKGQSASDDSCSDDESPKRNYREMLTRRPSYRKILNDLGGAEIAGKALFFVHFMVDYFQTNIVGINNGI